MTGISRDPAWRKRAAFRLKPEATQNDDMQSEATPGNGMPLEVSSDEGPRSEAPIDSPWLPPSGGSTTPIERGKQKLLSKRADLIVANDISTEGSGFDSELNAATLISHDGVEAFPLGPKTALAAVILDRAEARLSPLTT